MSRGPDDLVRNLPNAVQSAYRIVDEALVQNGAESVHDVKTIYVSYMVGDEMVAAVYPTSQGVEVALALPEDHPSPLLQDATHLTWRTLPVCVDLADRAAAEEALDLLAEAVDRVVKEEHHVVRDNDYFMGRRKDRRRPNQASK